MKPLYFRPAAILNKILDSNWTFDITPMCQKHAQSYSSF